MGGDGETMKNNKPILISLAVILLVACYTLLGVAADSSYDEERSTNEYLYARGLLSSVSIENGTISVRPAKGNRIKLKIEPTTIFEGFQSLEELERKQQVKVWYEPFGETMRALKVEKMMELGC